MRQVAGNRSQRTLVTDKGDQRFGGGFITGRRRRRQHRAEPAAAHGDQHIVEHAHGLEQFRRLIGAADSGTRDFPRRRAREFLAAQTDAAGARLIKASDHVEHCRLAGTIGPDHAGDLAWRRHERDMRRRLDAAEGDADIGHVERRMRGTRCQECRDIAGSRATRISSTKQPRDGAENPFRRQPQHH